MNDFNRELIEQCRAHETLLIEQTKVMRQQREVIETLKRGWKEALEGWDECSKLLSQTHLELMRTQAERDEFETRISEIL